MLYNPNWERIYTTENFAAWLLKQPAAKRYDFCKPTECAIAQYLKAQGVTNYKEYMMDLDRMHALGWKAIVCRPYPGGETFGAAARRALRRLPFRTRLVLRNDWRTSIARAVGFI